MARLCLLGPEQCLGMPALFTVLLRRGLQFQALDVICSVLRQ
ncbi:hypothetical protein SAMN05216260_11466 [Streptomyces griseoaurantiacus]|uniref:Uncharacterized protein n=1 Tax=Streptomyces griseoaurantiacus TaxID=68213 RepID=A0A1G7RBK7_9ACTN|nr:hypothetical protein SAMN05216260_11466 [Streptomyces jietaisiensis]